MNRFPGIIFLYLFLYFSSANADIQRASVSSTGEQANASSFFPDLSEDGRYIVYASAASNLVPNDLNGNTDIFVRDSLTGVTELISVSSTGDQATSSSFRPIISANGRFVVFASPASNLVPDDTNFAFSSFDVFMHDRQTGITERINVSSSGEQANDGSLFSHDLSSDGRYVAFTSLADNLVENDTNNKVDVFVRDRQTGITERVSVSTNGVQSNGGSASLSPDSISLSANGELIVFSSIASNLVPNDLNNQSDIFIHNRFNGVTERLNISQSGPAARKLKISDEGRFVAFSSSVNNLVPGDTNDEIDIFVHDRETEITELISVYPPARTGLDIFVVADISISGDGRFVVYHFDNSNTGQGPKVDSYIYDRQTGLTRQVARHVAETDKNTGANPSVISQDGSRIVFRSLASDLVPDDTNQRVDVFVSENPLLDVTNSDLLSVEKLINHKVRNTQNTAAQLLAGSRYRTDYRVTNNSPDKLYRVQVFENGELVCNVYTLEAGQSETRCATNIAVLVGDQNIPAMVTALTSGSNQQLSSRTDAYYNGLSNVSGELSVTHNVNNASADTAADAVTVNGNQAEVLFRVENTGSIELYRIRTYHDPVSPSDTAWQEQCFIGILLPGQVRYCKRTVTVPEAGLNKAFGRAQGANANVSATGFVNATNQSYLKVVR